MVVQSSPFPEHSFPSLYSVESRHWWFQARVRLILWALQYKVPGFSSFLEIGCGTGFVISQIAKYFPGKEYYASELYESALVLAKSRNVDCRFKQLDATKMSDIDSYDCIGCFDVLEHISTDNIVIENIYAALKPKSFLLVTVPQHKFLWSSIDSEAHHVRRYARHDLLMKLKNHGFHISYSTSFVSLLLPLMYLQRRFLLSETNDSSNEFNVSKITNRFLSWIMAFELILIKIGISLPFGGSLFVIAFKD